MCGINKLYYVNSLLLITVQRIANCVCMYVSVCLQVCICDVEAIIVARVKYSKIHFPVVMINSEIL